MTTKVLVIVEDEPDMRLLVRVMLAADPRFELIGEAASARDAITLAEAAAPGLVVLDHTLEGDLTGLMAAPLLKAASPGSKIILFSAHDLAAAARDEPAVDAFVPKTDIGKLLATAQRLVGLDSG